MKIWEKKFTIAMIAIKQLWKSLLIHFKWYIDYLIVNVTIYIIFCHQFNKNQSWKDGYAAPKPFKDFVKKCRFFFLHQFGNICLESSLYYHSEKLQCKSSVFGTSGYQQNLKFPWGGIKGGFECSGPFYLKNVSGCGKEGAKYPLFLLI